MSIDQTFAASGEKPFDAATVRTALQHHAREIGMLLGIDKADVYDAVIALLPPERRTPLTVVR